MYDIAYFAHYQTTVDPESVRVMKRATYHRLLRRLDATPSNGTRKRLLDCGAATGFLCEQAQEMDWDAFAVEFSDFGAEACAQLLGPDHVYRGDVLDAAFAGNTNGRYEAITMFDFIEHVREPLKVLSWARKHLVPKGALLIGTPQTRALSWRLMGSQWFGYTPREHLWFFSAESIKQLLRKTGFSSVEVQALPKAVTVGYALAHYAKKTNHSPVFSPISRWLWSVLGPKAKRQRFWFYLGDMCVTARA